MPARMYKGEEKIPGKTVIVTGANTGIGKETARDMARRGARVILACRSLHRGQVAVDDIVESTGNNKVLVKELDLSSFHSIRTFCEDINENEERIDILINNAGVFNSEKCLSADGLEATMAVNHFGHFLLIVLLLDKIKASAPSRIVVLSSMAHRFVPSIDFDDFKFCDKPYKYLTKYGESKLANMLMVLELSKRLQGTGVTVYAVHPGLVDTEIARHTFLGTWLWSYLSWPFRKYFCYTSEQGAQTSIYCALAPDLANESGKYYQDCQEVRPAEHALNEDDARTLWEISEDVTLGLKGTNTEATK